MADVRDPLQSVLEQISARAAKVAVVGQGYVGLVVAMRASEAGFPVVGYDIDRERVKWLRRGESYLEDVTDQELREALDRGYVATDDPADMSGFDVAVISVPTPLREELPDLGAVETAARTVGRALRPGALVVLESTTYPGTTEELLAPVLTEESGGLVAGRDFLLGYSPERIDPGNPTHRLENTPKIVSGVDEPSRDAVAAFFGAFVDEVVAVSTPAVAELSKLIENTFRHVNIALVNELAMFAAALGVDMWEAIDAASTKPFGFMAFRPGPGVGGHCLPIDPTYLSWRVKRQLDETFRFVELANDVNRHMPSHIVTRIQGVLNEAKLAVNGSRIVVLGYSYKPNTADARESPARVIVKQLSELGANVAIVDPHVRAPTLSNGAHVIADAPDQLVAAADLVVLVTDHDAFDYDRIERGATRIFDTRRRFGRLGLGNVTYL